MTLQDVILLEDYGLSSIVKDMHRFTTNQQPDKSQPKQVIQQQTDNTIHIDDDDDAPLSSYLLDRPGQDKNWTSQQRIAHQLVVDIELENEENDEDLLPISVLHDTKAKGLYRCLSAAEKYKNSILYQDPELLSVLAENRQADVGRDLLRLSQYQCKERDDDDDDDDIPLFQTYFSLLKKTSNTV